MADTIIYLVISLLVSLIFVILGIRQYRAEKPVVINTGEKPPREDELISVTEWNHRHGRNFINIRCKFNVSLIDHQERASLPAAVQNGLDLRRFESGRSRIVRVT